MADVLTAVKTARASADERSETFLSEVSSRTKQRESSNGEEHAGHQVPQTDDRWKRPSATTTDTLKDAFEVLQSQPSTEDLVIILRQLTSGQYTDFNLHAPGPLQAQIVNTIITSTIPTFWSSLDKHDRLLLLACLSNIAGVCAVIARLRLICVSLSSEKVPANRLIGLKDTYDVACALLRNDDFVLRVWDGIGKSVHDNVKRKLAWKELITLLGSGKIISSIAQAEDVLKSHQQTVSASWLAKGTDYATWLGRNIAHFHVSDLTHPDVVSDRGDAASQLLSKALRLDYQVVLVGALLTGLVQNNTQVRNDLASVVDALPAYATRQLLENTLAWLSTLAPAGLQIGIMGGQQEKANVSAYAALLVQLIQANASIQQELFQLLADPGFACSISMPVRQASLTALAALDSDNMATLLERLISTFGDQLFIDHAPAIQQESIAQLLLITAGFVYRKSTMTVLLAARSSGHMQGVSNRLHSTHSRARWLGMVVGTTLSTLVDKDGSRMSFDTEEMRTADANWYQGLVNLEDNVGTMTDFGNTLKSIQKSTTERNKPKRPVPQQEMLPVVDGKQTFGPPKPPAMVQTEVIGDRVAEVLDEGEEEDDDLKPYAKPDSDPEDSDEDATLVNRNKVKTPVYIRDLMRMLKDDKDHDCFQMGLRHAATLIRRKADFGREVRDHAEELALTLCGLQDPFSTDDFDQLRLQALIAILLSDVEVIAPWLSKQAFTGDYSLSQRCVMLSALGLGGRELAGLKSKDGLNPPLVSNSSSFPGKRLPPRLHAIYGSEQRQVPQLESASKDVEHQLIKPLTLSAADESTSHLNALKVRTFSSRMDVERTRRKPAANKLAKIFGPCFFFPLASRYQQEIAAYGTASVFSSAPIVLVTFLKTLALLLHASGPATLGLPDISTAFWDLLLSLRVQAAGDISILEAVLFSLLTLLEMNADAKDRVINENPKQLVETQQWVEIVFEKTGGGQLVSEGSDEETRVRTLAAGVLVKTREVIDAYQKVLMGHGLV